MSLNRGVIPPDRDDDLFIGWAPAPNVDRRFLFAAMPLLLGATSGLSWLIAKNLGDPGAGKWATGKVETVKGALVKAPYPMIRVADASAPFGLRTWLVVAQGKCTGKLAFAEFENQMVTARGALIARKDRRMLEVPIALNEWLEADRTAPQALFDPPTESLGSARLSGMIMDSKCFFGVMRPSRGKTHKECASLCIRGGIPPSFWARGDKGRETVLLMTDENGAALRPEEIIPLVADPVSAEGEIFRVGDLLQFRARAGAYRRV